MQFDRILLSSCKKIKDEEELAGNFSSVTGEYFIPKKNRTGFYKANSSSKSNADLRELLASIVLEKINMPVANIELAYNEEKDENGCFSMNILDEGEKFLEIFPYPYDEIPKDLRENSLDSFIESDLYVYKLKYNFTPDLLQERKKFLIKYVFISAFLGNEDIKTDNCQAIFNEKNGTIRNPEYYDMGLAFKKTSENGYSRPFFQNQTDIDVLQEIYAKYPIEIKEISEEIENSLNKNFIRTVLDNEAFNNLTKELRNEIWQNMGEKITYISKQNELLYKTSHPKDSFIVSLEDIDTLTQKSDITLVDKAKIFLHSLKQKMLGGNER